MLMLTQIIMSLADATQPAFSTMVMMIKCCNCAQLHSYFQLILSMPCSSKLQILSNSICAEAPVVIRLVVGWPKLGNFLHHMDQFRVPHPVRYPYLLQGIPFPHATGSPPNPQRDQSCCTSKCSFPSMLWYEEFGSVFFFLSNLRLISIGQESPPQLTGTSLVGLAYNSKSCAPPPFLRVQP